MSGDGDATARLWDELSGSLRSWFRRRTGDPHAAEDLLQECFLRVHDGLDGVRDTERVAAWVRGVARNLLVDWRRAQRPAALAAEVAAPLEQEDLDRVVAAWLAPEIEALPDADRDTLRLTELEGLTQREAAARLGVSLAAVKSRVLRGREKLRARILACCELEFDARGGIVSYRRRRRECC